MVSLRLSALLLCLLPSVTFATKHPDKTLAALADPATTSETATRIISDAILRRELTGALKKGLPAMLLAAKSRPVVQNEARVAGALKLESTIPSLVELLSSPNFDFNTTSYSGSELLDDPVARALFDIGAPAESSVANALYSEDYDTRRRAFGILIKRNTPNSRALLETYSHTTYGEQMRSALCAYGIGTSQ